MPLQFNAEGVVPMIAQGWRQPTLGYACSEEVNAVGVVRFLRGMPRCYHSQQITQGRLCLRLSTLDYQKYNAYSVA